MTHPVLTLRVLRSIGAAPVSPGHRIVLLRRFLVAAARQSFLRRHRRTDEIVLLDEGLVHRVINVFAWRTRVPGTPEVRAYLAAIPRPDALVVVEASGSVRRRRLEERGLPARLIGRSQEDVRGFLQRADRLLALATTLMRGQVPTNSINTDGAIEDTVDALVGMLAERVARDAVVPAEHAGPWPRWSSDLPRLDRVVQRRRVRPAQPDPIVEAVLGALGRRATGPARIVASGRSQATVVPTDGGPAVLKRYKPTLDDAAIENEHAVLRELAERRLPAPRLIAGPAERSWVELPDGRYAAYEYLGGYHPAHERITVPPSAGTRSAGAVLGELHRALATLVPPADTAAGLRAVTRERVRDAAWHATQVDAALVVELDGDAALRRRADWIQSQLHGLERDLVDMELATTTIHGDYGPYNLLVRTGAPVVPIDFELARLDWRIVDLVTAVPRFASGRFGPHRGAAERFLAAYEARWSLSPIERAAMPRLTTYLALRRVAVTWRRASMGEGRLREAQQWLRTAIASAVPTSST